MIALGEMEFVIIWIYFVILVFVNGGILLMLTSKIIGGKLQQNDFHEIKGLFWVFLIFLSQSIIGIKFLLTIDTHHLQDLNQNKLQETLIINIISIVVIILSGFVLKKNIIIFFKNVALAGVLSDDQNGSINRSDEKQNGGNEQEQPAPKIIPKFLKKFSSTYFKSTNISQIPQEVTEKQQKNKIKVKLKNNKLKKKKNKGNLHFRTSSLLDQFALKRMDFKSNLYLQNNKFSSDIRKKKIIESNFTQKQNNIDEKKNDDNLSIDQIAQYNNDFNYEPTQIVQLEESNIDSLQHSNQSNLNALQLSTVQQSIELNLNIPNEKNDLDQDQNINIPIDNSHSNTLNIPQDMQSSIDTQSILKKRKNSKKNAQRISFSLQKQEFTYKPQIPQIEQTDQLQTAREMNRQTYATKIRHLRNKSMQSSLNGYGCMQKSVPLMGIQAIQDSTSTIKKSENDNENDQSQNVSQSDETNQTGKSNNQNCLICFELPSDAVYMDCGHGGLCYQCSLDLWKATNECYLCRKQINQVLQIDLNYKNGDFIKVISSTHMTVEQDLDLES